MKTVERKLTVDEIRLLALVERKMDSGEIKFVRLGEHRVSVQPEVMTELGLVCGQTITDPIYRAILEQHLAYCQTQLALQRAAQRT